jgi:hypothetical protein
MVPEVSLVFWIHDLCLTACPVQMKTHYLECLGVYNFDMCLGMIQHDMAFVWPYLLTTNVKHIQLCKCIDMRFSILWKGTEPF